MKRNKTNRAAPKSGTSPYARYRKSPYRYSDKYYTWRRDVTGSNAKSEAEHAREHSEARKRRIA